ncbi:hypothetical protein RG32_13835 [Escherichia coli]|nr:hypothetical protein RG32_13835 [Escherichia coli]APJ94142.1 hypothetical protein RG33_00310 [Escherichia coli]
MLASRINISQQMDNSVDISVQDNSVSLVVKPKKSLIIQKLASLTWEQIQDPAPSRRVVINVAVNL